MGEIFANYVPEKRLISEIYKKITSLTKNNQNPKILLKMGKCMNAHFPKENTKQAICISTGIQCH